MTPVPTSDHSQALTVYEPSDPLERAMAWAALAIGERRRRAVAACQDRDASQLAELTAGYLLVRGRARTRTSEHTLKSYAQAIRQLLRYWPHENLLHPAPDAADRYVAAMCAPHKDQHAAQDQDARYRPATVAAHVAGARALYRALRWARATEADPFGDVRAPHDPTPRHERRQPYSEVEVEALLATAGRADRALILLCAHAGLRISEALSAQWADLDLSRHRLRIAKAKGGKQRTVPLSATLVRALEDIRGKDLLGPIIVGHDGRPYADPTVPRRHLRRLCAGAKVQYRGFHSLRHSAGTRLAKQTGDLQLVAAHLGHTDVATAAIYAKWSDDTLSRAVQDW